MFATLLALTLIAAPSQDGPTITSPVGTGEQGFGGDGGPAAEAELDQPFDVAFGPNGDLYLSDTFNQRIRRVDTRTGVITTVAGSGRKGFGGDGGPATEADLDEPYGLAIDPDGNLYFADRLNRRVRRVDARTGVITTVAGDGSKETSGDGGPAAEAGLVEPNGVSIDDRGRLYIADVAGHRVRVVDLATGTIDTFAGNGQPRHSGDGGPARDASIHGPRAVEAAPGGTVVILERNGNRVLAVDQRGVLRTVAGTGDAGYSGDGERADRATLNGPKEMALDLRSGALLVVDTENHAIRRIDNRTGVITTVAGNGTRGGGGDDGPGAQAQLDRPHGVALGPDGSIWIGDTNNHRIRRVSP